MTDFDQTLLRRALDDAVAAKRELPDGIAEVAYELLSTFQASGASDSRDVAFNLLQDWADEA